MNWIQISETQGVNLDHIAFYYVEPTGGVALVFVQESMSLGTVSGEYAKAFLKRVGHTTPGTESADIECPTCEGNGYTMSAVSAVRVRCAFCKGTGKATI